MPVAYETRQYQLHASRVGSALVQTRDGAEVYFQPGDDDAWAREEAARCFDKPERYPGENDALFDSWASEHFSL